MNITFKLFCAGFLLFCQAVVADSSYLLSDALALVLLHNPGLHSFSYDVRANEAKILQAALSPNPLLDVETENIDAPEFRQTTFLISQLIELGGKRDARIHFAKTERDRVSLDYEVQKRELFIETGLLFIDVLVNQQKVIFLEENLKVLQDFSAVVEKRVNAGKASVIEQSNFIVLLNTSLIDLQNAQNELKIAKYKLAAKWGAQCGDAFTVVGELDWMVEVIPLELMGELIQEHPQVVAFSFEENVRLARIALEQAGAYPDLNVRGGPRYLEEARRWVWVVGFTIPIPISDRNQGRIIEAKELLSKLETEREVVFVKLLSDLNTSYATLQHTTLELNLLKNSVLPAAKKGMEFSYQGYNLARYNYLEFLETERAYRTSKMRYLQVLAEYHKALTVLQGLTGSKAISQCE